MIRVIGIGSPFGDDQAGWWVIQQMRGRVPAAVDLVQLDRPGVTLVNWMPDVSHLYLIDAVADDALTPGRVLSLDVGQLDARAARWTSHQLNLTETLRLADALVCRPARIDIYGIAIRDISAPSATVWAATGRLARDLADTITGTPHTDAAAG